MAQLPEHHVPNPSFFGARFQNPFPEWPGLPGFSKALQWQRERKNNNIPFDGWLTGIMKPTPADYARHFPSNPVDWKAVASPPADAVQAVWVGHATILVQMGGLTFLTDPVMSERCAPVQWAGPKRVVPPAFHIDDPGFKALDFVLISHNHYDHLDTGTVAALHRKFGHGITWYVPLGLKDWFASEGIKGNVVELDWWQSVQHTSSDGKQARITMTPAMHWSARGVLDRCKTLWGSYAVHTDKPQLSFWFAGDTGYCQVFKEIGQKLGPFDLAAVPIGAYEPRWFMRPQHVDPQEGLLIHQDIQARTSLSIHCCTWCLTDESLDEPPKQLVESLKAAGKRPDEFVTLQHGALMVVKDGKLANQPPQLPVQVA